MRYRIDIGRVFPTGPVGGNMRIIVGCVSLLLIILTQSPIIAAECQMTTSDDALAIWLPDRTYYFVKENGCANCSVGVQTYLYEETNGVPGLQRHDALRDDTCGGKFAGDGFVKPI